MTITKLDATDWTMSKIAFHIMEGWFLEPDLRRGRLYMVHPNHGVI